MHLTSFLCCLSSGLEKYKKKVDSVPRNLAYIRPEKSLSRFLPELKKIISTNDIKFVILDSLGASSLDPENVGGIVDVFIPILYSYSALIASIKYG